jgi:signal transduction histidine kinase
LEQVEALPHDANSKATLYVNIASDYRQLKLADKGYDYVQKITPLFPTIKDALKIAYYYELYQSQVLQGKNAEALASLQTIKGAIGEYDLNEGQQLELSVQYHEQAGQFEMTVNRNYAAALTHFQDQLRDAQLSEDDHSIVEASFNVGWAYDSLRQYEKAVPVLKKTYEDAVKFELSEFAFKSAELLSGIYQKTNNPQQGFYYARMSLQLKDSIVSAEKLQELNFLEGKYQSEKKEKEIAGLKVANTEKELVVVKRNRLLLIGGLSAFAMLLIFGLLYRGSKQRQTIAENEQKVQQQQIKFLEKQQQVVSMQSMVNGQEAERTRIAKDLHDGLGGLFSTIKMQLSTLKHDEKHLEQNALFAKSYELVDSASVEVRRIAHNMMPEVLMKLGLVDAVRDMCSNISAGKMLTISLQAYGMEKRLNSSTEIMLYRIVQELLNNIIKHAQATEAIVQFNRQENRLHITIEDNGKGFNTQQADEQIHAGLETVQSRVNYLKGNLSIESEKGLGTTVMMDFLINEQ